MVNLEARKLVDTANQLSAFYLQDGLCRIKFVEEIKQVVEKEFATARHASTDEECMVCIKNLRAETENLREQEHLLRTRAAQLYAKVEFVRENNKIVGYVIFGSECCAIRRRFVWWICDVIHYGADRHVCRSCPYC